MTPEVPAPPPPLAPGQLHNVQLRGPLLTLLVTTSLANFGYFLTTSGAGLLIQVQVEVLDPARKVQHLALLTTLSGVAGLLAQPIAGLVSDRTRTRFGSRAPWMVAGSLVGALALIGLAFSNRLTDLILGLVVAAISYNFILGPLSAVLPDRVPVPVRGAFSAFLGLGYALGAVGGQVVAAHFASSIPTGYLALAGFAVVFTVLFAVITPGPSNRGEPRPPFSLRQILRLYWFNPARNPDFAWAFLGRLLLFLAFYVVNTYLLYLLQDYIGLGARAVKEVPVISAAELLGLLVGTLSAGPISDRLGRRKLPAVVAGLLVALGLAVPLVFPTVPGILAYGLIVGLGVGSYLSIDQVLMSQVLPDPDAYARDLGVLNIAATLPMVLAPAIAGGIVTGVGYRLLFPVGILLGVVGAVAVLRIRSVR